MEDSSGEFGPALETVANETISQSWMGWRSVSSENLDLQLFWTLAAVPPLSSGSRGQGMQSGRFDSSFGLP